MRTRPGRLVKGSIIDCNNNDVADHMDIAEGDSLDDNEDGVPDECEPVDGPDCFCSQGSPCSNNYSTGGCKNSTGLGGRLLGGGSSSIYMDDLEFAVGQLPSQTFGVLFYGLAKRTVPVVMGAGLRCTGSIDQHDQGTGQGEQEELERRI